MDLMALGYTTKLPTISNIIQGLLLCIKDPTFHKVIIDHDLEILQAEEHSKALLRMQLDILVWFRLYALSRENMNMVVTRIGEIATDMKQIQEDDPKDQKKWLESFLPVMRKFMDMHGKKLRNDPMIKQRRRQTLQG